ncbi:hypothetical protein ONR57_20435 [Hoyosella sp. YIM 151337]|uniref:2-oxo-4-hydroxy-4-carboxy-5-ureidoimidazoline decarboxylase n=1 Tax=Hoyosella sp. YIM 151337 TaxID=2992742 RepID=UPI002235C0B4|nr:2-oxo-4-hydroxy-4-carboxy-5-ureidoimidazoline decarboxylase [Hoyosella sp. YIM 151337]MCW4355678.1 hypothetical protein [Hoyosella sp. YIM 151337]
MTIAHFNSLSPERAAALLISVAHIPRWVNTIVDKRPFPSVDRLLEFAERASMCWTQQEVSAALAKHAQITERVGGGGAWTEHGDTAATQQTPAAQSYELRTLAMHRLEWLLGD